MKVTIRVPKFIGRWLFRRYVERQVQQLPEDRRGIARLTAMILAGAPLDKLRNGEVCTWPMALSPDAIKKELNIYLKEIAKNKEVPTP